MLLGGLGLVFALSRNTPAQTVAPPTSVLLHAPVSLPTPTRLTSIVVHISGAVVQPGVYELPADARTADAVQAAGGLLTTADQTRVNLAARLEDAQQIIIPVQPAPALAAPTTEPSPLKRMRSHRRPAYPAQHQHRQHGRTHQLARHWGDACHPDHPVSAAVRRLSAPRRIGIRSGDRPQCIGADPSLHSDDHTLSSNPPMVAVHSYWRAGEHAIGSPQHTHGNEGNDATYE